MTDARPVRKRHYIDQLLQRRLIVGLLVLECALLVLTLVWLQGRMESIIEARLFRVHQIRPEPLLVPLLKEGAIAIGVLLAGNVILLLAAETLWTRHVNRLLSELRPLLERAQDLDFRPDTDTAQTRHGVVELARAWRGREAIRLAEIRATIGALDPNWRGQDTAWLEAQHTLLAQLQRLTETGHRPGRG